MKSNSYEILFILKTTFSEEERNKISENLQNILTKSGAKIIDYKPLGLKDFAMELKKQKQGYYFQLRFIANNTQIELLQEDLKVNEKVFRHLIVTLDSVLTKEEHKQIMLECQN